MALQWNCIPIWPCPLYTIADLKCLYLRKERSWPWADILDDVGTPIVQENTLILWGTAPLLFVPPSSCLRGQDILRAQLWGSFFASISHQTWHSPASPSPQPCVSWCTFMPRPCSSLHFSTPGLAISGSGKLGI